MLEKHLRNSFLLQILVEILQLVHETSSFPEVLYQKGVLKTFSKYTQEAVIRRCSVKKAFLKILPKNLETFEKIKAGNLKPPEAATEGPL